MTANSLLKSADLKITPFSLGGSSRPLCIAMHKGLNPTPTSHPNVLKMGGGVCGRRPHSRDLALGITVV